MKNIIIAICVLIVSINEGYSKNDTLTNRNNLGIDFVPFEGNNYNVFGGVFDMKYIRKLHKRADILTSLGIAYPVFPFGTVSEGVDYSGVYGRFTLVPCYVPMRRNNKTIELGLGYITDFHKLKSLHGITTQFNFLNESKRRKFTFGVNVYINMMFASKEKGSFLYGGGTGFFFGGFFDRKHQSK